jgi:hypothetical protein
MSARREAMYLATFGLALVLAAATVLFVLVGLNPKGDYGPLPWLYSGASLVGGSICWRISSRLSSNAVGE